MIPSKKHNFRPGLAGKLGCCIPFSVSSRALCWATVSRASFSWYLKLIMVFSAISARALPRLSGFSFFLSPPQNERNLEEVSFSLGLSLLFRTPWCVSLPDIDRSRKGVLSYAHPLSHNALSLPDLPRSLSHTSSSFTSFYSIHFSQQKLCLTPPFLGYLGRLWRKLRYYYFWVTRSSALQPIWYFNYTLKHECVALFYEELAW